MTSSLNFAKQNYHGFPITDTTYNYDTRPYERNIACSDQNLGHKF